MKTIRNTLLIFACALLSLTNVNAQWGSKKVVGNGSVTTKTVTTGDYDGVKGVGSMDIHLERGSEGTIKVTTDDNLHEYLEIEVKDNTLVLKTRKNVNLKTKKGIHITVPFKDISEISLIGSGDIDTRDVVDAPNLELRVTGSGDVNLDVNTGKLEARVTGSGDIRVSGKTVDLKVNISGSGDFHGFELSSKNTEATVSGSGDIRVVAQESIKARVNGSGDITYTGNPAKSDTKTSGSGRISSN